MNTKNLMGLRIDFIDFNQLRIIIEKYDFYSDKYVINYANAYSIVLAAENEDVKKSINSSNITFPDGTGVYLAAKLLLKIPEASRFNLTDHAQDLLDLLENSNARVFLLGATNEILEMAKSQINKNYNGLRIVGSLNGYENINDQTIIATINNAEPDVLLVGMGTPKQEIWVHVHSNNLNAKVILCVGDLFTLYADKRRRGPAFFRKIGLEWLFRVILYPDRYFARYIFTIPRFFYLVSKNFLTNNLMNRQ